MAPENEKRILAEMLAGLTKPALRVLSIRYGTSQSRIGLWQASKGQLIEDLLAHTDELLKGQGETELAESIAALKQGQTEIQTGQADLKEQVQTGHEELKTFIASKIEVSWWDRLLNSTSSWASIFGLILAIIALWPKTPEPYQVKIHVLEEDGSHAVGATVDASPWQGRVLRGSSY